MTTEPTSDVTAPEHGVRHPSDGQYVMIGLILAGLTAIEVALSYVRIGGATNPSLLALAAIKFAMVAMFFMHLRFDKPILRRLFVTGLILAVAVYVAYLMTLGVFIA